MIKNGRWYPDDLHTYKYELKEDPVPKDTEVTVMEIALEVYKTTENEELKLVIEDYYKVQYGRRK